jgi:hypothetical protein
MIVCDAKTTATLTSFFDVALAVAAARAVDDDDDDDDDDDGLLPSISCGSSLSESSASATTLLLAVTRANNDDVVDVVDVESVDVDSGYNNCSKCLSWTTIWIREMQH